MKNIKEMTQDELNDMHIDAVLDIAYTSKVIKDANKDLCRLLDLLDQLDKQLEMIDAQNKSTTLKSINKLS